MHGRIMLMHGFGRDDRAVFRASGGHEAGSTRIRRTTKKEPA